MNYLYVSFNLSQIEPIYETIFFLDQLLCINTLNVPDCMYDKKIYWSLWAHDWYNKQYVFA